MAIDLNNLRELTGNDPVIIKKTLEKFLKTTPAILDKMDEHLQNASFQELSRSAHKLKSSVNYLGMEEARQLLFAIEQQAKGADSPGDLPQKVGEARQMVEAHYPEIKAEIGS